MHSPSRPCTPRYSSTHTSAEKPAAPSRHERPTTRSRSSGGRWRRPLLRPSTSCPSSSLRGVPAARSTARLPDAQQRLLARAHSLQQNRRPEPRFAEELLARSLFHIMLFPACCAGRRAVRRDLVRTVHTRARCSSHQTDIEMQESTQVAYLQARSEDSDEVLLFLLDWCATGGQQHACEAHSKTKLRPVPPLVLSVMCCDEARGNLDSKSSWRFGNPERPPREQGYCTVGTDGR